MTIVPAYGRDYKSAKAAKADFDANKDFQIRDMFSGYDGSYVNKEQLKVGESVTIRYNKLRSVTVYKVTAMVKPEPPKTDALTDLRNFQARFTLGAVLDHKSRS